MIWVFGRFDMRYAKNPITILPVAFGPPKYFGQSTTYSTMRWSSSTTTVAVVPSLESACSRP